MRPWGVEARPATSNPAAASEPGYPGNSREQEFQARARYWSFQPLRRVTPPAVKTGRGRLGRNPIDRFILAALEEHGLTPAPEADRRTLIRRLSFDLTGLPPTPDEVEAFLADRRPTLTRSWSTGCWPARITASAGPGTGSTWSASPRPPGMSTTTTSRMRFAIATT